jgi:hypothetical protein
VLRDVYNSRQAEPELKQLTFLLTGAFHPRDLIKDVRISPFNIAQRIRLADFTIQQVENLVGRGPWTEDKASAIAERVHYWTSGQPYLTQLLCSYLPHDATPRDVDVNVERLRRQDENNLPPIIDRLQSDRKLCEYTARILRGERIKFYPREHRRQADLELLGVIKEGPDGYCTIRNRLYRKVLLETIIVQSEPMPKGDLKPKVDVSQAKPFVKGSGMDYKQGLQALEECLAGGDAELQSELATLEERLSKNQRDERIFGSSENIRSGRSQIIFSLNELAITYCGVSFNEMCKGKKSRVKRFSEAEYEDIVTLLQELKSLVVKAAASERRASERLWRAVQEGRVEQGEVAATVDALRRWARSVQKRGLPVDEELRTAIVNLAQPTESIEGMYHYLHFALPLLPGLLSIEAEIDLHELWSDIRKRWDNRKVSTEPVQGLTQVTILLEGQIDQFTQEERKSFVFALSRIIDISPEQVRILQVTPGSILITLEMPNDAVERLLFLYSEQNPIIEELKIKEVKLVSQKGQGLVPIPTKVLNTGRAWAVLVGINHYEDPYISDLHVCVEDVSAVEQSLDSTYQVTKLLTDATAESLPTRANILGELSAVSQSTNEGDLLLFYFSGHGMATGGESYLLARDTRLSALKHTSVSMRDVRELMDLSPARAKVIILDACHSGASIGKAEPVMTPEFIRRVFEEAEGMAVLASCKQGQKSWEWSEQGRSVFTHYLLEALSGDADLEHKKGFVTVSDASRYVTDGVKGWAAGQGVPQTPTLQYTVAGDIVLIHYKDNGG